MDVSVKPVSSSSMVDVLRRHSAAVPNKVVYRYLERGEREVAACSYWQLHRNAGAIAAWLQREGMSNQRVLILLPNSIEFIEVFMGCLMAKAVAVPQPVPGRNKSLDGLQRVALNAEAACVVTTKTDGEKLRKGLLDSTCQLAWLYLEDCDFTDGFSAPELHIDQGDTAFIQYTSGSTGQPKGVVVSHGNLMHNEATIEKAMCLNSGSLIVNWLPLFHDMGLIGSVLQPLYLGASCVIMDPTAFVQKPIRWLRAITNYQATTTGGPNFAYDLCVSRVNDKQRENLDLSSLTVAFTGSEPVRAATVDAFNKIYEPHGFSSNAFFPCYGMAEHTLYISGSPQGTGAHKKSLDADALAVNKVVDSTDATRQTISLVSCGVTQTGTKVSIVEPQTLAVCGQGEVGEIWVRSDSVAQGYWNNAEQTKQDFRGYIRNNGTQKDAENDGPYLRTGDLGFIENGGLYVTGRCKDVIIIRGRNYYPQDIEAIASCASRFLVPGACAAIGVDIADNEELVVVSELTREGWRLERDADICDDVRESVIKSFELRPYRVVLIKPGTLPKTTSGKIRRSLVKQLFISSELVTEREIKQAGRSSLEVTEYA